MCSIAVTSFSNQNLKATVGCHTLCLLQNRSNFPLQTGDCSWAGGGRVRERDEERQLLYYLPDFSSISTTLLPTILQAERQPDKSTKLFFTEI